MGPKKHPLIQIRNTHDKHMKYTHFTNLHFGKWDENMKILFRETFIFSRDCHKINNPRQFYCNSKLF